jgi:cellulose synthase/poly-beta-1,6-N-acetylglucosamine synthase-like glycosyltransferase
MIIAGYPWITKILARGRTHKRISLFPHISVIVPAFNEEKYIKRKIENLRKSDYPAEKLKIFIVDNNSSDGTFEIANTLNVNVLQCPEKGKNNAINTALKHIDSGIVLVSDADTTISRNAIRSCSELFHENIGGVNAATRLITKNVFYIKSKSNYIKKDWDLRYMEGTIDSMCNLDGKFMMFRRELVDYFPDENYVDDYWLTFHFIKKGYRCICDNESFVYEEVPKNILEEFKQMKRRTHYILMANPRFIGFNFNRKYGYFGTMTFPFRRFYISFIFIIVTFIGVYLLLFHPYLFLSSIILYLLYAIIFGEFYHAFFYLTIGAALLDVLVGKKADWGKIET